MTDNFILRTIIPTPYGDQEVNGVYIYGIDEYPDIYHIAPVFGDDDDAEYRADIVSYISTKFRDCAEQIVDVMIREKEDAWLYKIDDFRDD